MQERTSEVEPNIYQGRGPSARLSPDHSHMSERVSTTVVTSVINARQELGECSVSHCASKRLRHRLTTHAGSRNAKHRRLLDYEDEDGYRGGRVPGPGSDVDAGTHDHDQDQETELRDRKRERDLDGGRDVGKESEDGGTYISST